MTDWTLRLKSLQQIQDFIQKEDTTLSVFQETYKNLNTLLTAELKDIRSAIVKESIKVLTTASKKFRNSFDSTIVLYIDALFSLSCSTTNAISKSASDGLKSILESIYSSKVLLKVLENSKQKTQSARLLSTELVFYALSYFPKSILDTIDNEFLLQTIKSFICDSGKIREAGKDCFLAFVEKYPEKGDRMIALVVPVSKKLAEELKSLRKTYDIDLGTEFPANVEISEEEWQVFEKLNVFEAVRLAVSTPVFQSSSEIHLESLLEKVDSPSWNTREKAFLKILEVLKSAAKINELEVAVKKVVEHIKDSHVKVVSACMECLIHIAEDHSITLTSYFPDLLQVILEISLNKKEELSENANKILEKLLGTYPPDDLLIHFLSISSNKTAVKFALIEIVQYLLEVSESFCFSSHNMNLLCKKFSGLVSEGSKTMIISVIKALEKACDKNVFGTLQAIQELPYEDQAVFKKYCQDYSNLLNEMLKGYSKTMIPNTIDVIEEVEEEDLTGSILEPSEPAEDLRSAEEIISNLQYYLTYSLISKAELKFEKMQEIIQILFKRLNPAHNEESKKALRSLAVIGKYYRGEKVGVELVIVLSKALVWDNQGLLHDLDNILKSVVEKLNTGSAVIGILESLKKLEPPALQIMIEYLISIIKERNNVSFFGKEIGIRLKDVRIKQFFAHPHPEVRKNVVLALAELLGKMEEKPFLAIFNQGQQKLIEIYREKLDSAEDA